MIRSRLPLLLAGALVLGATPLRAQQQHPGEVVYRGYVQAVGLVQAGRHQEALNILEGLMARFGSGAYQQFGPVFGNLYYYQGIALVNLGRFAEAAKAFETCYVGFPNRDDSAMSFNSFRTQALVQWAGSELMQGNHENAIRLYEQAMNEGGAELNRSEIILNLAQSFYATGQVERALQGWRTVAGGGPDRRAPRWLRQEALTRLCRHYVEHDAHDDINAVLDEFGELFQDRPDVAYKRNPMFLHFAHKASQAEQHYLALRWYEMLTRPGDVLAHLEEQVYQVPPERRPDAVRALREFQTEQRDAAMPDEAIALMGIGYEYFQLRNYLATFTCYRHLADHYPRIETRPQVLHTAVASAVRIGYWDEAVNYGLAFLDEFPHHELLEDVIVVLVEVLFFRGDYERAYEVAKKVRPNLRLGSLPRDPPDFVIGGSAFMLDSNEEAKAELDAYVTHYPEGRHRETARFYQAAVRVRLLEWSEASPLLESFLVDYPDSVFLAPALHYRALCHFMEDEIERCLERIGRIEREFPDYGDMAAVQNLKGDALQVQGQPEPARVAYRKGKDLAEAAGGMDDIAAYATWQLIGITVAAREWRESEALFREFERKYATTPFRIDATVTAIPAMEQLGHAEEILTKLEALILAEGGSAVSVGLAKAFNGYRDLFVRQHGHDRLIARLRDFPGPQPRPRPLESWLMLGQIEAHEDRLKPGERSADVRGLYLSLDRAFRPTEMANYVLVKLARFLQAENRTENAVRLYDFILTQRPESVEYHDYALLDLGLIDVASDDPEIRRRGRERLLLVRDGYQTHELMEAAQLGLARLETREQRWSEALREWRAYLANRGWNRARAEANYHVGLCYDRLDRREEALKTYVNTYVNFESHIDWSSRAYLRTALIQRERGDRENAFKVLDDMMKRMGHLDHDTINRARGLHQQWQAEFAPAAGGARS